VIFLVGDFPAWLPVFTLVGGVTTALVIGGLTAAGLAAAGGTAYEVSNLVQGNMPWDDWAGWFLGHLKGEMGGIGSVISAAKGDPTIQSQLRGATTSTAGTGGEIQGASGQGPLQQQNETLAAGGTPAEFKLGGQAQPAPAGGGGAARYDAMDAADSGDKPNRGKILAGAAKDIGIGAATTAASLAIPYASSFLGPAAQTAAQVGSSVAAPATEAAGAAVPAVAGVGAEAASTAPSFASSALQSLRAIPDTIGTTATGILQKSLLGAGMGAAGAALKGQDPLRAAAMGGAGGAVSGIAGYGASQFAPPPVPTLGANPFPMPEINSPDFVGGMAPGAPTLTSTLTGRLPSLLGSAASQGVGYMMQPPLPAQPASPIYSSRPSYYDVYDINGPGAAFPGRRPYWG
jgi:hypothetical protein